MTDTSDMTDEELAQAIRDTIGAHKCCATCKHWDQFPDAPHLGLCTNLPMGGGKAETIGGRSAPAGGGLASSAAIATTDLAVCSKWEQKDDEQ